MLEIWPVKGKVLKIPVDQAAFVDGETDNMSGQWFFIKTSKQAIQLLMSYIFCLKLLLSWFGLSYFTQIQPLNTKWGILENFQKHDFSLFYNYLYN